MKDTFEVVKYNITNLEEILLKKSEIDLDKLQKKLHRFYFKDYFSDLKAKTIIVENEYIDHDFLEDFTAYYVKCFTAYKNRCSRIHFFRIEFNFDEFNNYLKGERKDLNEEILSENYLGFIVIKPLPLTIFGRTCLITYPQENHRYFPIIRKYTSNLFGLQFEIESLAFQEQDNVVAACATSALWSVFHGTGILFQHTIPSPAEITKIASEHLPFQTRILPNKGLNIDQMAYAIKSVGLEPFLSNVNKENILKRTIYAYLKEGIPMILGVSLYDTSGDQVIFLGKHAIAISGYSLEKAQMSNAGNIFIETSSKINKIYVHDDQVGPFARMIFDKKRVEITKNSKVELDSISTSWMNKFGKIGDVRAVPEILLIPLYHKIRIPFLSIYLAVLSFDDIIIKPLIEKKLLSFENRLEWDIYLWEVNKIKREILNCQELKGNYYSVILTENMPRFIWRATALYQGEKQFDLLFDATDIEQGNYFLRAIFYNNDILSVLKIVCDDPEIESLCKNNREWQIIKWFKYQN